MGWSVYMRCAVAAILAGAFALPGVAVAALPLGHEGRWITDAAGRAVILHGVNMVFKRPPYHAQAAGFNGPDARFLGRHGFNTVRVGVIYKAVEPAPGEYDDRYLRRIARTERALAREDIYSLLDFHQDLYNEKFGGEGFPDWAVLDDSLPAEPKPGFPVTYFVSPGMNRAWSSLWANRAGPGGVGLQDRYAAAWRHVARRFRDRDLVMGYDLINEPWPGIVWPTCTQFAGCPDFEQNSLGPMQDKAVEAIRSVDPRHTVWYEPSVTTQGGPTYWTPHPDDGNVGMSFHVYCSLTGPTGPIAQVVLLEEDCPQGEQRALRNAVERADQNGDTLLMSEFGATDDAALISRIVDDADRNMVSWQWWHYCACDDPTTSGPGDLQAIVRDPGKPARGSNVIHSKLALLERPYPQAVAGTPQSYSFDRDAISFELRYSTTAPGGKRMDSGPPTEIHVPRIHYPDGRYRVQSRGARVVSSPGARLLKLQNCSGADRVSVSVVPGRPSRSGGRGGPCGR
jgi:endoglycosylceramidase